MEAGENSYANGQASGSQLRRDIFVDPSLLPPLRAAFSPPLPHSQSHTTVAELAAIAALSHPIPSAHSLSALQHIHASKGLNDAIASFAPSAVVEGKRRAESEDELKEGKRGRGRPKGKKDGAHVNREKRGRPKGVKNRKGLKKEREKREREEQGIPEPEPKKRGRPRGSRNKPKPNPDEEEVQAYLVRDEERPPSPVENPGLARELVMEAGVRWAATQGDEGVNQVGEGSRAMEGTR